LPLAELGVAAVFTPGSTMAESWTGFAAMSDPLVLSPARSRSEWLGKAEWHGGEPVRQLIDTFRR
jgi:hypothetical protein